jgi:hypothetical protein
VDTILQDLPKEKWFASVHDYWPTGPHGVDKFVRTTYSLS